MYSTSSTASSSVTEAPRRMYVPTWTWTKPSWPNPELSIDRELEPLDNSHRCWDIKGPVLELATKIYSAVQQELDLRSEYLVEKERIRKPVLFRMYMIGRRQEDANPTLLFSCSREQPRRRAKEVVKQSGILRQHPAIRLAHSKRLPQAPTPFRLLVGPKKSIETTGHSLFGEVYCISPVDRTCGVPVFMRRKDGSFRKATIGGIVQLGDTYYGLTVAHTFVDDGLESTNDSDDDSSAMECSFDSDDDLSVVDLHEPAGQVEEERYPRRDPVPHDSRLFSSFRTAELSEALKHIDEDQASSSVVGNLFQYSTHTGLDWALISIDNSRVDSKRCNAITLSKEYEERTLWPRALVTTGPLQREILAITGDKGVMQGSLSPNPMYMRTAHTRSFQELWVINMASDLVEGDCGSWVVDRQNGQLYGQIVAGHPGTGIGYIIPASQIFESVWQTLGDALILPSGTSVKPSMSVALAQQDFIPQLRAPIEYEQYRSETEYYEYPEYSQQSMTNNLRRPPEPRQIIVQEAPPPPMIVVPHHEHSDISRRRITPWSQPFHSTLSDELRESIQNSLLVIFSDLHLSDDMWLRSQMDSQGYIAIPTLGLNSTLRGYSSDLILAICRTLPFLEVELDRVRRRHGWAKWVLPYDERGAYPSLNVSSPYKEFVYPNPYDDNMHGQFINKSNSHYGEATADVVSKADEMSRRRKRQTSSTGKEYEHTNDRAIARILQRNEKDAQRLERRDPPRLESRRPKYTRMSRRHLSLETLRIHEIDHEIDPADPDYVLIKRWVPEVEQKQLWEHTRSIRFPSPSPQRHESPYSGHVSDEKSEKFTSQIYDSQFSETIDNSVRHHDIPNSQTSKEEDYRPRFISMPSSTKLYETESEGLSFQGSIAKSSKPQRESRKRDGNQEYIVPSPKATEEGPRTEFSLTHTPERSAYELKTELPAEGLPPLPPDWISLRDEASGSLYYFHRPTQIVQWEFPAAERTAQLDSSTTIYIPSSEEIASHAQTGGPSSIMEVDPDLEEAINRSKDDFHGRSKASESTKSRNSKSKLKASGKWSSTASDIGSETSSTTKKTRDSNPNLLSTFLAGGKKRK